MAPSFGSWSATTASKANAPIAGDRHPDQGRVDEFDEHDRDDYAEELDELVRWLRIENFDRRAVNRQLAQLGQAARTAA